MLLQAVHTPRNAMSSTYFMSVRREALPGLLLSPPTMLLLLLMMLLPCWLSEIATRNKVLSASLLTENAMVLHLHRTKPAMPAIY